MNFCGAAGANIDDDTVTRLGILASLLAPVIENLYVVEQVTADEAERRQFLVRELEAGEDERRRIARELHDGLAQTLTGMSMTIDGAIALMSQRRKDDVTLGALQRARDSAVAAMRDIRSIILHLRPPALDDMGLFPALESYARRVLADAGIELDLHVGAHPGHVTSVVENVVFRATQEAINNVARHSRASVCRVRLSSSATTLRTCVEDDGVGFTAVPMTITEGHFGIANMKERVELIGGTLTITSAPGAGSKIEIKVPYGQRRRSTDTNRNR
jgi:two-component system sensor histidine kinase DegS